MTSQDAEFYLLQVAPAISIFWIMAYLVIRCYHKCERWKADTDDLECDNGESEKRANK